MKYHELPESIKLSILQKDSNFDFDQEVRNFVISLPKNTENPTEEKKVEDEEIRINKLREKFMLEPYLSQKNRKKKDRKKTKRIRKDKPIDPPNSCISFSRFKKRLKAERQILEEKNKIDKRIFSCYIHFRDRLHQRYQEESDRILSFDEYLSSWVGIIRGEFLFFDTIDPNRMVRLLGDYIQDKIIYRVIYIKIPYEGGCGIYVPLTIYPLKEQNDRLKDYKTLLVNKRS